MPRSATTGIYTRVDNSFSNPVLGTAISPTDADTFFDDVENAMNAFLGTSTSSVAIGTGAKTLTIAANASTKSFLTNTWVIAFSQSNSANYMYGTVTSYNTGTGALVLNVTDVGGSGTITDWAIIMAGGKGATGSSGSTGATGAGYTATSSSSVAIASSGSKVFTTQSGLAYTAGARVRASDTSAPTVNYMEGVVTAYSGTTLTFTADRSVGSGTLTSWNINLVGDKGADGAGTGDFSSNTSTSVDSEIVLFSGTAGKTGKRATGSGVATVTSGVLGVAGTSTTATFGTVELGHASDTTLSRSSAGVLAVEGVTVPLNSTSSVHTASTIELGNASDTTLSRSAAGVLAVEGVNALLAGKTDTISKGFTVSPNNLGNITNFTIDPTLGNYQYGTNHAAATWTAPASDCAVDILVTNDASAGSITFSGFTVGSSTGDSLTTTNTSKFLIMIRRINATSTYVIKALQ